MFKKSAAAAYSIRLDEMKRVTNVMSTQQTRPYIPSHFSRLTPRGVRTFSRHFSAI